MHSGDPSDSHQQHHHIRRLRLALFLTGFLALITASIAGLMLWKRHVDETALHQDPCVDLEAYICQHRSFADPTGKVFRDVSGEVEVLRIYESIVRNHKGASSEQIDELFVNEVYSPDRVVRLQRLFAEVRGAFVARLEKLEGGALRVAERKQLVDRIQSLNLELPIPASVYADSRELFSKNDVLFQRLTDGRSRIRMGGAMLFSAQSEFNLAFTLAHELAHTIDPCELEEHHVSVVVYPSLITCLGFDPKNMIGACGSSGKLSEVFADWLASQIVADILTQNQRRFSPDQRRAAIFNSVRDLCRDEDDDDDNEFVEEGAQKPSLTGTVSISVAGTHPPTSERINKLFGGHPRIRELLGCSDADPESSASNRGVANQRGYCHWPSLKKKDKTAVDLEI